MSDWLHEGPPPMVEGARYDVTLDAEATWDGMPAIVRGGMLLVDIDDWCKKGPNPYPRGMALPVHRVRWWWARD